MKANSDHVRVTHGGNLPLPDDFDKAKLPSAVQHVVDRQLECGVDVLNDGEYVKAANLDNYVGYIYQRVAGWENLPVDPAKPRKRAGTAERDRRLFPGVYESGLWYSGSGGPVRPGFATPGAPRRPETERVCTGPVRYVGQDAVHADVDALGKALAGKEDTGAEGFVAALGPLSLGAGSRNEHYGNETEYMTAVAEVVREEYKAIVDAGFVVQVDEPEFATTWQFFPDWDLAEYRRYLDSAVEIINHALEGLPEEQVRFHFCWGSGHRPHVTDIGIEHLVEPLLRIKAQAYAFEAGNVRHAHEWTVWKDVRVPEGKILVPGVVSHATDLVEHPGLVAERLLNFASVVGRDNLQAGTDCGIGSRVGHQENVWAKLRAMSEGAALASARLWRR